MYVTASAGGGGSTPDSGSVVSLAAQARARTSSSTASRMNGIDGRMLRASTLSSGRWCASSCCTAAEDDATDQRERDARQPGEHGSGRGRDDQQVKRSSRRR